MALSAKAAAFQLLLTNKIETFNSAPSEDIDTYCDSITSSITEAALNTAGKDKARRPDKLSLVTKQQREKRRQMKINGTDVQHIEYTEIYKAIRSQMSEDINNYNEEQLTKSLEDNKGIKTIKRKQCLGRSNERCFISFSQTPELVDERRKYMTQFVLGDICHLHATLLTDDQQAAE